MGFASRGSPSPKRMGFASRGSPSPKRMGFASGVPPLQSEWDSLQGGPLLQSEWDSPQGGPPLQSERDSLQGTLLHLDVSTHPVLRLVMTLLRDPHRGLILRRDPSTSLPVRALQTLRFPRDRFWPGAMPCRMPSLTHNRDSLIASRMEGSAILCCLLSTSSRECPINLLKEKS